MAERRVLWVRVLGGRIDKDQTTAVSLGAHSPRPCWNQSALTHDRLQVCPAHHMVTKQYMFALFTGRLFVETGPTSPPHESKPYTNTRVAANQNTNLIQIKGFRPESK